MALTIRIPSQAPPVLKFGAVNTVKLKFGCVKVEHTDVEPYTGDYNVIPDFTVQTLETAEKLMTDDVTVEAIPVHRTDNPAGGRTIFIGGILNG